MTTALFLLTLFNRIALAALLLLSCSHCTLIGAKVTTQGYGFTVSASVAGFSTEAGFNPKDIITKGADNGNSTD